jgi:hypothetical protein
MKFYAVGHDVYARGSDRGDVRVGYGQYGFSTVKSAQELAEFLNWLHELYARESSRVPGKSGFEAANCSSDGLCFGELDGRCG